jgi:hypothetical protein
MERGEKWKRYKKKQSIRKEYVQSYSQCHLNIKLDVYRVMDEVRTHTVLQYVNVQSDWKRRYVWPTKKSTSKSRNPVMVKTRKSKRF